MDQTEFYWWMRLIRLRLETNRSLLGTINHITSRLEYGKRPGSPGPYEKLGEYYLEAANLQFLIHASSSHAVS